MSTTFLSNDRTMTTDGLNQDIFYYSGSGRFNLSPITFNNGNNYSSTMTCVLEILGTNAALFEITTYSSNSLLIVKNGNIYTIESANWPEINDVISQLYCNILDEDVSDGFTITTSLSNGTITDTGNIIVTGIVGSKARYFAPTSPSVASGNTYFMGAFVDPDDVSNTKQYEIIFTHSNNPIINITEDFVSGATVIWNEPTQTLTLSGIRSQINNSLNNGLSIEASILGDVDVDVVLNDVTLSQSPASTGNYTLLVKELFNWNQLPNSLNSGAPSNGIDTAAVWALSTTNGTGISDATTVISGNWLDYCSKSEDSGATWSPLPRGLNSSQFPGSAGTWPVVIQSDIMKNANGILIAGFSGGFFSRSADNGQSWAALPQYLQSDSGTSASAIDTNGLTWVVGFRDGHASRSINDGLTWNLLPQGLNSGSTGKIHSIVEFNNRWVALVGDGYASYSTDSGNTWTAFPRWFGSSLEITYTDITASTNGAFVACGQGGALRKNSFEWLSTPWDIIPTLPNGNTITTGVSGEMICGYNQNNNYLSIDNGETWNGFSIDGGTGVVPPNVLSVAYANGNWIFGIDGGEAFLGTIN